MSKLKKALSIVLPTLLAIPQIAIADLELEEIEVTTPLRVSEKAKNVIADTTVITSDEIKRAGLSSLPQLLQQQPGIEVTNLPVALVKSRQLTFVEQAQHIQLF